MDKDECEEYGRKKFIEMITNESENFKSLIDRLTQLKVDSLPEIQKAAIYLEFLMIILLAILQPDLKQELEEFLLSISEQH